MKITASQLRRIIKEEISKTESVFKWFRPMTEDDAWGDSDLDAITDKICALLGKESISSLKMLNYENDSFGYYHNDKDEHELRQAFDYAQENFRPSRNIGKGLVVGTLDGKKCVESSMDGITAFFI